MLTYVNQWKTSICYIGYKEKLLLRSYQPTNWIEKIGRSVKSCIQLINSINSDERQMANSNKSFSYLAPIASKFVVVIKCL